MAAKHSPISGTELIALEHAIISAVSYAGFEVTTADGEPATLAILDKHGNIVESGENVRLATWNVAIHSYREFLKGMGYLRVHAGPPTGPNI
jgi:hypothetical protein